MAVQKRPRLTVLISGGGTTLQNLIDQIARGVLHAEIASVISSRSDAGGIEKAERAGLPVCVVKRVPHESFSKRLFDRIALDSPDWVILAGWLQLIHIPEQFTHRVLNIHPSLLPAFGGRGMYGDHVHNAVLNYGTKVTGCTVHFADNTYDTGPIILQRVVPVQDSDNAITLGERVFQAECTAYPEAIQLVSEQKWLIEGRRVRFF